MSISIRVERFRGCSQAELSCAPISLLCGLNDAGKSSTISAIAAALTGSAIAQYPGLTKGKAGVLVRTGSKVATARVKTETGEATMEWPSLEHKTTGDAPFATPFAAGLMSLATMPMKERPATMERYIKAEPTEDDLKTELGLTFGAGAIDKIWALIQQDGWDEFHAKRVKQGTEWTGAWGQITGEKFGSDKAKSWAPDDWEEMLLDQGVDSLENAVRERREELERALGDQAVDQAQLDGLRTAAGELDPRSDAAEQAQAALHAVEMAYDVAKAALDALPPPQTGAGLPCPHCGGKFILVKKNAATTVVEKFEELDPEKLTEMRNARASAEGEVSRLSTALDTARRARTTADAALKTSIEAVDAIAGLGERKGAAGLVESARARLAEAERDLAMTQKVIEARSLYTKWEANARLVQVVAPTGLRAKKLGESVAAFNSSVLAPLCETAGWPAITLTEDLGVMVGPYAYELCGVSYQMRARIILQLAQAKIDGSAMVLIDAADTLDAQGKNGLFKLLKGAGIPAVVGMTLSGPHLAPDLEKAGMGVTSWIADGVAKPLNLQEAA